MKLAAEAAVWHKLWSMRLMIASTFYTAAAGAWVLLPSDWKPELSHTVQAILAGIGVMLPASASVARVIKQGKLDGSV